MRVEKYCVMCSLTICTPGQILWG